MMKFEGNAGFAVKALTNQIHRALHQGQGENGVTGMQNAIIGMLADAEGDVYQRDVEKHFNIRGATASGILKKLEQSGFILREGVQGDARRKRLRLTDKGRAQDLKAQKEIARLEACLTTGFTQAELDTFFAYIRRMSENLKQLEENKHHD